VTRKVEWHVLTLVTLGLTAFGIVMVYSATSASAAIGGANPMSYLERQATYAVIGIAGLLFASRFDYRRLRALAPVLVLAALGGCDDEHRRTAAECRQDEDGRERAQPAVVEA
jgi:cell division protein FtsW